MSYYKFYKGHQLGPYYYPREPRAFTKKDLARIAKYVADKEGDAMAVFITIAVALGFGKLLCDAARITRSFISITHWMKELSVIFGTAALTNQFSVAQRCGGYRAIWR